MMHKFFKSLTAVSFPQSSQTLHHWATSYNRHVSALIDIDAEKNLPLDAVEARGG